VDASSRACIWMAASTHFAFAASAARSLFEEDEEEARI